MNIPLPELEPRLQRRYQQLVNEHLQPREPHATGSRALPSVNQAFASTQAAWRFYANPRVSLPELAAPLLQQASQLLPQACRDYALVIHDWSQLHYAAHTRKRDRKSLGKDLGYELATALLISDQSGAPLVPLCLSLRAADGWHSSLAPAPQTELSSLDQLTRTMQVLGAQAWPRPLVHIIDRAGDSVFHYRQWQADGERFLVRANEGQRVVWQGETQLLAQVASAINLRPAGAVEIAANLQAQLLVGEAPIVIDRPAFPRVRQGKRQWIKGEAIELRLIVCQLLMPDGSVEAQWSLLSNLEMPVSAPVLAEWYYWRWRVESYFKLLKSHGYQLEQWQQETAAAIAKRLLVTAMACVVVWLVQRASEPEAMALRELLLRLSGRQVRRGQATAPALLAGLWVLLSAMELLEHYDLTDLQQMARIALPGYS
jgi:hypothetical protein